MILVYGPIGMGAQHKIIWIYYIFRWLGHPWAMMMPEASLVVSWGFWESAHFQNGSSEALDFFSKRGTFFSPLYPWEFS